MEEEKNVETVEEPVVSNDTSVQEPVSEPVSVEEPKTETVVEEPAPVKAEPKAEPVLETREPVETKKEESEVKKSDEKKKEKNRWWIPIVLFVAMVIIILLLLTKCGKGDNKKYKIKIHNGDEIIEVDKDFKLKDLEVEGGTVGFLVDSDGHVVDPSKKLDPEKEYSVHIIPEGKEKVKVTYVNGDYSFTVTYQKGSGLLFPADPTKEGYVFIGWKDEEIDDYPIYMTPVLKDMTLVAQFEKSVIEGGKCTLNCDTNNDGICDLNCDKDGDGKPDTNIDTDGDGKCDYKCDIDGDGKCDLNCESSNLEMEYTYGEDNVTFGCQSTDFSLFMSKSTELVETKIDGVAVEPDEWNMNANSEQKYATWNKSISKYLKSGKTVDLISTFIKKDDNDQKYYKISTIKLIFPSKDECDAKPNNCADTNEDGKCDEDLLLLTDDYDITLGCNVGLVHRQTKKGELTSSTVNGEEVEPDETLDVPESKYKWPTWYLTKYKEIGEPIELIIKGFDFNENGERYEYVYTSYVSFTGKCTNSDVTPEPTPSVTYTCPDGYQLSGDKCINNVTVSKEAELVGYSCDGGFTYYETDGRCHKQEEQGCPAGYNNGPNGCERQVFADLQCNSPYVVAYGKCCWNNTDGDNSNNCPGRENPHCPDGYALDNSGTTCYKWLYDAQRGCYNANSTEIPGSFLCDTIGNSTPNYSCSIYGNGYSLNGNYCIMSYTETIDAIRN